jgi:Rps23 Pro-64 3,4-dihydroxylase Tpa1-like proline 4-hydroxylase
MSSDTYSEIAMLQALDRERLRREFANAKPFPYVKVDNFIDPAKAEAISAAYPEFEVATSAGLTFSTVNERKKVQITDSSRFPPSIAELNALLASPRFLDDLSYITGIPRLLADDRLTGGGMHITCPGGRLDVHVDFNYIADRKLHRRLNLLLYLNSPWEESWGGQFQLWDRKVKRCETSFAPIINRCVIFETSEISYHGVVPVSTDARSPRKSFATYYYTSEAPAHWTGVSHGTVFKARPDEKLKGSVLMPVETAKRKINSFVARIKHGVKSATRN